MQERECVYAFACAATNVKANLCHRLEGLPRLFPSSDLALFLSLYSITLRLRLSAAFGRRPRLLYRPS